MPSARVTLCTVLVLLCTSSLAQSTSTPPPRGVPGAKVESVPSKDLFEVLDDTTQRDARSVVAFMCANRLVLKADGNYEVRTSPLQPPPQGAVSQPVCTDQPFKSQPVAAFCSGVLITPTVVATSAGCLTRAKSECGGAFAGAGASVRAVFGYSMRDALTPPASISGAEVVPLKRILKQTTKRAGNWALVELNQAMDGRAVPLRTEKIRRGTVRVIGHPQGLPTKIAQASSVESSAAFSFTVAPASLGSSLGTPAFSAGQVAVEGLVVDDPISWRCSPSTACCKTGPVPGRGSATTVIRASALASSVCTSTTLCGTACVNTSTDPNHCGQCGNTCDLPNATEACSAGGCRIAACEPNRANCDRVTSNGCETQLGTVTHCSACNDKCATLPNTIPACNGTCQWSCKDGYADCTDSPGCETLGSCTPVCTPASCTDNDPCTQDVCDAKGLCTHPQAAAGSSCGSGAVCTASGRCAPGCWIGGVHYAPGTTRPDIACQECNPALSTSTWSNKPAGTACDDGNVCTNGDACNGAGQCSSGAESGCAITRIRVYGAGVGGGGSSNEMLIWYHAASNGGKYGAISGGIAQFLYEPIDWSVPLVTPIRPGQYFVLGGNEGSNAVSRTFEFYDSRSVLIGTNTVSSGGTSNIVRHYGFIPVGGDQFTLFYFDGYSVKNEQVTVMP